MASRVAIVGLHCALAAAGPGCAGGQGSDAPEYGFESGLANVSNEARFARAVPTSQRRAARPRPAARTAASAGYTLPPRPPPARPREPARQAEPADPPAPRPPSSLAASPDAASGGAALPAGPAAQGLGLTGESTGSAPPVPAAEPERTDESLRASQRVQAAASMLGMPGLADRAFVAHVLRASAQDIDVDRNVGYAAGLHARLDTRGAGVPHSEVRPGDLVFFRDTSDLNGNGRPDDGVTLVGIVERAHGSHVVFIAQRAGKVRRMAVDPKRPLVVRDGHQVVNTRLVRWPGSQAAWTTGQCLAGYARPR